MISFDSLNNKKVLVTGAGGFIASHLVEELVPLCGKVTALLHYDSRPDWSNLEYASNDVKQNIDIVGGDVRDAGFMYRIAKGKDIVFHLAALIAIPFSYRAPAAYFQTNTLGTVNVLEACREHNVERLVAVSTSECYGTAQFTPIHEGHPLQAQSPYSASKIAADKAADSFFYSFELPVVIIRPFNTFGPRQSARAVIPTIISQALSDSPSIRLGALSPIRDFTFVKDTVYGMISGACAKEIEGETINLGVGKGISIGDLAENIIHIMNCAKKIDCDNIRLRPDASEVLQLLSDNSKAKKLMDWEPKTSLEEGLEQTIQFVKEHQHIFKTNQYTV